MGAPECPESVFSSTSSDDVVGMIILQLLGIPVMALGLYMAFFGARIKTVLIALQMFMITGLPMLLPIILGMIDEVKSFKDITPVMCTSLVASFVSATAAVKVLVISSEMTKAMFTGFTTGLLFSGLFMSLWLPHVADMGLREETLNWIILGGALFPGLLMAAIATKPAAIPIVFALSYGLLGGFLVMGVLSGWIGGGDISIYALTTGNIGACDIGGYISIGLFLLILGGGMYFTLSQKPPPGIVSIAFAGLVAFEIYLISIGPDGEAMREEERQKKQNEEDEALEEDDGGDSDRKKRNSELDPSVAASYSKSNSKTNGTLIEQV